MDPDPKTDPVPDPAKKGRIHGSGSRSGSSALSETRGFRKLQRRVKNGEIVVYVTDKSGKFCITSLECYERQGAVHTAKDQEISWEDVTKIQRELKAHIKVTNLILDAGSNHGEQGTKRTRAARELQATSIPGVSLLAKDHIHKPRKKNGDPET